MTTENIHVFARWKVQADKLDTVLPLIHLLAMESKKETGNIDYIVCQSLSDPSSFHLFESYVDSAAVEAHKSSDHFKQIALEQIVPLLEQREVFITKSI